MKVVKKKMKKPLIIAILAAVLAVLTCSAILINTLLIADEGSDGGTGAKTPPEIMEELGEAIYANNAIVYSRVERDQMDYIDITTTSRREDGSKYTYGYTFFKDATDEEDPFILSYTDESGEQYLYYPEISLADPTFSYEDLYAIEQNDSYGTIPKLTYLCNAIGTIYFGERIAVSSDAAEREDELKTFGLSEDDDPLVIKFSYVNDDGTKGKHSLKIGDPLILGSGYYFMVDERPYVYTTYTQNLDYAFLEFSDFINPILTAAGLAQDNAFEPYLTTDFKQWKNTLYHPYYDENGKKLETPAHHMIIDGATVIVSAQIKTPDYTGTPDSDTTDNIDDSEKAGGYIVSSTEDMTFNLSKLASSENYARLVEALKGQYTGDCNIIVTIPSYSKEVNLKDETEDAYHYEITSVESIITDRGEITNAGTPVGENTLIKIGYNLKIGSAQVSDDTFFGVIDISSELVPVDVRAAIAGMSVGTLETPYEFTVLYNESNTAVRNVDMVITEIIEILNTDEDSENVMLDTVAVGSKVAVRYYLIVDGEKSKVSEFYIPIEENMEGEAKAIADAIMGKTVGDCEIEVNAYSMSSEIIADFKTYEIEEIKYFYTSEEIVSFKFQQASERDAYYGESIYTNTMTDEKYKMYALNASACEAVVRVFGGLLENAAASNGLIGTKTVDVVLTPEKMEKYGLYAHTVYFELPRGITTIQYDGSDLDEYLSSLDDYTYYSTLGFTLYISDADPITGNRYIASDLYDIVAEVDGANFEFLDQSFIDFYARRNIVLTQINDIENIKIEFFMDDVKGGYNNDLVHYDMYVYNGKVYSEAQLTEEQLKVATKFNLIDVVVDPDENCNIQTALSEYLAANNIDSVTLRELYGNETVELDSLGTANFKEFIETLFYTTYEGYLTEEEQTAASGSECIMRMSVELYKGYSAYDYVYEFYRISDRRVMVKLYRQNRIDGSILESTVASDFYISTFSFKKLVNKYFDLLNANYIDNDTAYPDYSFWD